MNANGFQALEKISKPKCSFFQGLETLSCYPVKKFHPLSQGSGETGTLEKV